MTIQPIDTEQKVHLQVRQHTEAEDYLFLVWPDTDSAFFLFMQTVNDYVGGVLSGSFYIEQAKGLPDGSKFSLVCYPVIDRDEIEAALTDIGEDIFEIADAMSLVRTWQSEDYLSEEIRKEILFVNERTEQPYKIVD